MGYNAKFSNNPEILVCGSILGVEKKININKTRVWGIGLHNGLETPNVKDLNMIYAVRGKLSLKKLNSSSSNIILGDPGLLLSRFYKPKNEKKYDICIISHYIDYKYFLNKYGNIFYIINMGTNNIKKIANSINKCNFTFSSSLHGIIFSHSLGIPSVHLEYNQLFSKKNFKFKDYYSILKIPYIKENIRKENLDTIIKKYKNNRNKYLPKNKIIKKIQDNLLFSFPYQKMTYIICTYVQKDNKYINEWCKYHLSIGFDNIYIINNIDDNYIGDYLDNKIKNRVHILNINEKQNQRKYFYKEFYNRFNSIFKWCAFIDITDYIILIKRNTISHFFRDCDSKNISIIKLNYHRQSFNNIIDKSLQKSKNKMNIIFEIQSKSIIKGGFTGNYMNLSQNSEIISKLYLSKNLLLHDKTKFLKKK